MSRLMDEVDNLVNKVVAEFYKDLRLDQLSNQAAIHAGIVLRIEMLEVLTARASRKETTSVEMAEMHDQQVRDAALKAKQGLIDAGFDEHPATTLATTLAFMPPGFYQPTLSEIREQMLKPTQRGRG